MLSENANFKINNVNNAFSLGSTDRVRVYIYAFSSKFLEKVHNYMYYNLEHF